MRILNILVMVLMVFQGQSQTLRGIVSGDTDNNTTEPLIGATVMWMDSHLGTVTDIDGKFAIGVPPGMAAFVVAYVGYQADTIPYHGQETIEVTLLRNSQTSTVIVEGRTSGTFMSSLNPHVFQTINEKEIRKAACCNLSESFETNASIDASFSDAITGTKQIRMLGLEGRYTQMMFDNVPSVRGLASTYGLTYIPGPWIKNIYIAKGIGSVTGGFESMTGQINVAMKNPSNAERLHINGYVGSSGRTELNLVMRPKELFWNNHKKQKLQTILLAHGALSTLRTDMNKDGFMDNPIFSNIILRNEWNLETTSGVEGQYVLSYLNTKNTSGTLDYDPRDEIRSTLWGVDMSTERYEFTGKTGYVFNDKPWKSLGSQVNISWHNQNGKYGIRQYLGQQLSARLNLLYASQIKSEVHKFVTGISYQYDDYKERLFFNETPPLALTPYNLDREESVPGVFGEYTMNPSQKFTLIAGLRGDYHNKYGFLFTPRLHGRYSLTDHSTIKLIAGKGYRTASILMDNIGMLASNRDILIKTNTIADGFLGLKMEEAWNTGIIYTHNFKINYRDASLSLDAYRTDFVNQVVIDMEKPREVSIYNLDGKSYSNSAQAEFHYSPFRRFDTRLAYRWLEVRQQYKSGMMDKPLVNRHRAFANFAYETKADDNGSQWIFDATIQWISKKRIPFTDHLSEHSIDEIQYSKDYYQLNAQVTYVWKKNFEVYLGGENLSNFMTHNVIVSAENPMSENFDGSLVWGPVFGRMMYAGFRWTLQ